MVCLVVKPGDQHCQNTPKLATKKCLQALTLALKNKLRAARFTVLNLAPNKSYRSQAHVC